MEDTSEAATPVHVRRSEGRTRFEVLVGAVSAGYLDYVELPGGVWDLTTTLVLPECRGRGLATVLIEAALKDARAHEVSILPSCWAVARYLRQNPEAVELVPESVRASYGLDGND